MIKKALYSSVVIVSLVALGGIVNARAEESPTKGSLDTQVDSSTENDTLPDELTVENADGERLTVTRAEDDSLEVYE